MSEDQIAPEYNVGVDVEEISRFEGGDGATDRLFSEWELSEIGHPRTAERLAGTWCAKEATVKALWPWVHLDPRRVEVVRARDGRPIVSVAGWDADGAGVQVRVSISHSTTVATAVAVARGRSPAAEAGPASREGRK